MDKEQWPEWSALRDEAERQLKSAAWKLRLSMFPSFGNAHSLGIVIASKQTQVLHQVWRYDLDVEKFKTPVERLRHARTLEPTIEAHSKPIDASVLKSLLDSLNESLPNRLPPIRSVGLDGTTYEVAAGEYMHKVSYTWWGRGPQEWQALFQYAQTSWCTLASAMPDDPLPAAQAFAYE